MTALLDSAREGARVTVRTAVDRPALVPLTRYAEWSRLA